MKITFSQTEIFIMLAVSLISFLTLAVVLTASNFAHALYFMGGAALMKTIQILTEKLNRKNAERRKGQKQKKEIKK